MMPANFPVHIGRAVSGGLRIHPANTEGREPRARRVDWAAGGGISPNGMCSVLNTAGEFLL